MSDDRVLRAMPLSALEDVNAIKSELSRGTILILKITPLAKKSVEETKIAVTDLSAYVREIGGDIARLGEERIVVAPPGIRIWRERPSMAVAAKGAVTSA